MSDASLAQMPDFNQRVAVLRQLDYISTEDVVELKVSRCAPCSCIWLILTYHATDVAMLRRLVHMSAEDVVEPQSCVKTQYSAWRPAC